MSGPGSFVGRILVMRKQRSEGKKVWLGLFALQKAYNYWWERVGHILMVLGERAAGGREGKFEENFCIERVNKVIGKQLPMTVRNRER